MCWQVSSVGLKYYKYVHFTTKNTMLGLKEFNCTAYVNVIVDCVFTIISIIIPRGKVNGSCAYSPAQSTH